MLNIIYVRTSTNEQNPESQIPVLKNLCKEFNIENYEIIIEMRSAWKDDLKREKFEYIENLIKKNQLNNLVVWDIDRIYRNRQKLKGFFEFCKSHNCNILSQRQQFLNEIQKVKLPEGFGFIKDMMIDNFIQFLGWIAEEESKKKSERVKLAVRRENGMTKSYKGKKWGRKTLSIQAQNKIKEYLRENPKSSIRQISESLNMRKSTVHKYLPKIKGEKDGK